METISTWKNIDALGKSRFAPQSTEELCDILMDSERVTSGFRKETETRKKRTRMQTTKRDFDRQLKKKNSKRKRQHVGPEGKGRKEENIVLRMYLE